MGWDGSHVLFIPPSSRLVIFRESSSLDAVSTRE
jgi:hypothetical protein